MHLSFFYFLFNPFLSSPATAVLACWPEVPMRQLQKTDRFNPKGHNLSCRAQSVFKVRKHIKNWTVTSIMLTLDLLGQYFFDRSRDLVQNASSGAIWTRNITY